MAQRVVNEAVLNVRRTPRASSSSLDFKKLPKLAELDRYLSELTNAFMQERRTKLGREYSVTGISKMSEYSTEDNFSVYTIWFRAMSTTLKASSIVDETTLRERRQPSKFYTVKFVVGIDLTEYNEHPTIPNLVKALKLATTAYWCNCMSYNYQGMAYRAGPWSLRTQKIADKTWRAYHGSQSKVCKHIASISIDIAKFAPEIHTHIKKLNN
jgi:hypothetical protein